MAALAKEVSVVVVPFRVGDESARNAFLGNQLFQAIDQMKPDAKPFWGRLTAQQMLEHLLWAAEISNGVITVECKVPPRLIERLKSFLYDDAPTSHDFMNPLLKKGLPPLRFADILQAAAALRAQMDTFLSLGNQRGLRVHPVFGPLNHEEWARAHFKHFYHHLLQFGAIA